MIPTTAVAIVTASLARAFLTVPAAPQTSPATQAKPLKPLCVSCRRSAVNRPRGLCWGCYYTPGLRERFPSTSKYARRGVGNFCGRAAIPEPTHALPGTPEKVKVMIGRAERGEAMFHPQDARRMTC